MVFFGLSIGVGTDCTSGSSLLCRFNDGPSFCSAGWLSQLSTTMLSLPTFSDDSGTIITFIILSVAGCFGVRWQVLYSYAMLAERVLQISVSISNSDKQRTAMADVGFPVTHSPYVDVASHRRIWK